MGILAYAAGFQQCRISEGNNNGQLAKLEFEKVSKASDQRRVL